MKILVHVCCAPDAVYFLRRLKEDYPQAQIVGFFYDPNIHPYEEYKLRLVETKRAFEELGIPLYEGEYDIENWLYHVKGYEEEPEKGKRCALCFDYRLLRSLEFAKQIGATHLTTTLLMSPKKDFLMLKESGDKVCKPAGIEFLALDYRKAGGTQEMFKLSKAMEIYHQDYCGCIYGLFKQKKEKSMWDLVSFQGRRPGSKEEKLFIKEVRLFAESQLGLSCKEWEFSFLNWKLLLGKIEVAGEVIPSLVKPFSSSIRGLLKAEPVEKVGNTIYYSKGGLRVILKEKLEDEPLESIEGLCNPTFFVSKDYESILLNNRISATLQTEIAYDNSLMLLVGSERARQIYKVPADTLQEGKGIILEGAKEILVRFSRDIVLGEIALIFVGASTLGDPGSKYFEERTNKKPIPLLCSQTP
ncbi:MAG: epoxyqueuosine reductase QueH [Aquificaceae bacterium]